MSYKIANTDFFNGSQIMPTNTNKTDILFPFPKVTCKKTASKNIIAYCWHVAFKGICRPPYSEYAAFLN